MRTLSKEIQQSLTPDMAIDILRKGNERFINNLRINRNLLQQANETTDGQYPFAVVLSCIDSRTSAELIFDQGLGDIFSVRIAGNIVNEDILGSMEFGCKVAGAKVIVVLGHTKCGAVKGAYEDVELGNLTTLLQKIKPSVQEFKLSPEQNHHDTYHVVDKIAELNVQRNVKQIQEKSSIIKDLLDRGDIKIIGGMHNIATGEVRFFHD